MRKYTKNDVATHTVGYGGRRYPAINVKVYRLAIDTSDVMKKFNCSKKSAQKALEYAWESAREQFWRGQTEQAREIFDRAGYGIVDVYSEGRSGGWLVVDGLPDIDSWDAVDLAKWRKYERQVKSSIRNYTDTEGLLETIEANRWFEEGAEMYNFIERKDGTSECISELKQKAIEDGYGDVIRR